VRKRLSLLFLVISLAGLTWAGGADRREPKHLADARDLVQHVDLEHTSYEHGAGTVKFAGAYESHTDCSGFLDALLKHSYGYDEAQFKKWFGSKRPTAARYHDAIAEQTGFTQIAYVKDIEPGDILAVKYYSRKDNTGHLMLAAAAPKAVKPAKPLVEGTTQWEVRVIDSSKSGHGRTDSRHAKGQDGKDHDGLGEGVLRIYADPQGKVAGFSWSVLAASQFQDPKNEHLVIGRLKPGFKP
jgi:hypothetical protein